MEVKIDNSSGSFGWGSLRQRDIGNNKNNENNESGFNDKAIYESPLLGSQDDDEFGKGHGPLLPGTPMSFRQQRSPVELPVDKKKTVYLTPNHRNLLIAAFTFLAFATRFWRLDHPHSIVFDEVHFGGFASYYLRRTYFFDVHPPTGKLLYALTGWLFGYDGSFSFKEIHQDYVKDNVPYVGMRSLPALCGTLMVPLAFMTVNGMGYSVLGASLAAAMVLFENSFLTQSRYILLDAPMMLFIAWAVYCYTKFRSYWPRPFTNYWWWWLLQTGIALGLAVSVKWVGLFVIAFVGLQTIFDLWVLLGVKDMYGRRLPMLTWYSHFMSRAGCLIVVPLLIYTLSYYIHFAVLKVDGPGTVFMAPEFKSGLMQPVLKSTDDIASNTQVTLKGPVSFGDPFLHSHPHMYPIKGSSLQQQVTGYRHVDHNNWFTFTSAESAQQGKSEASNATLLKDGMLIHISHVATEKSLYVHGFPAPVTKGDSGKTFYEVSAADGVGHKWRVKVIDVEKLGKGLRKSSKIKLIHEDMNCALSCSETLLPDWGFNQNEVTCSNATDGEGSLWTIVGVQLTTVESYSSLLPAKKDRSGLITRLNDIIDLNAQVDIEMYLTDSTHTNTRSIDQIIAWDVNKRLTASHIFQSRPQEWPILKRGILYWQERSAGGKVYLLGNPLVFWSSLLAPPLYLLLGIVITVRQRRQCHDLDQNKFERFMLVAFLWLGYLLHYVPFFFMDRQLFLHHYLPAHYFMILAFAAFTDHLINWLLPVRLRLLLVVSLSFMFMCSFFYFAPLSYATPMREDILTLPQKWKKKWDLI